MAKKPLKRPRRATEAATQTSHKDAAAATGNPGATRKARRAAGTAPSPVAAAPAPEPQPGRTPCPIVGVGASAGGLEAFTEFLQHLPPAPGLALVLIQHLDPTHASQLAELLARATPLPVTEVKHDTPVEADHVYVLPSGKGLRLTNGVLHLVPRPQARGSHHPFDDFLHSLTADQGGTAFGIVLSGADSDGTLGLTALKAAGGIIFAQEPRSAKFDDMPR
ncbi:MAG: chemotaxis protein CheB, partial [Candidatus Binatia bacterium]